MKEDFREGSPELSFILMIDALGERYGQLPSKVIAEASTFDMTVYDIAISYRNHLQEQADAKHKKPEDYTQAELEQLHREIYGNSKTNQQDKS